MSTDTGRYNDADGYDDEPPAPAAPKPPRRSEGIYALYDTPAGGLHLVYREKGTDKDVHMEIPAFVVKMGLQASGGASLEDLIARAAGGR